MKKTCIIAAILTLGSVMVAANAAVLQPFHVTAQDILKSRAKREEITKHIPLLSKRADSCAVVECTEAGEACTLESSYCMSGTSCVGGRCYANVAGDPCNDEEECIGSTTICDDETMKCVARLAAGGSCTEDDECLNGLFCLKSGSSGTCTKKPTKAGDVCDSYDPTSCPDGLICKSGVCEAIPTLGDACDVDVGCYGASLICSSSTSTCVNLPQENDECIDDECASGFYCDTDNTCKKYPSEGEACGPNDGCYGNMTVCFSGVCRSYFSLGDGEECSDDSLLELFFCKEGYGCVPNRGEGPSHVCKEIKTLASSAIPCVTNESCPEDSYCACSSETGAMQCYPYPRSNQKNLMLTSELFMLALECAFGGDCDEEELTRVTVEYAKEHAPYSPEARCLSYTPTPTPTPGSDSKSSSSSSSFVTPHPPTPAPASSSSSSSSTGRPQPRPGSSSSSSSSAGHPQPPTPTPASSSSSSSSTGRPQPRPGSSSSSSSSSSVGRPQPPTPTPTPDSDSASGATLGRGSPAAVLSFLAMLL